MKCCISIFLSYPITRNPIAVSAVAAAFRVTTKLPEPGTTFLMTAVLSFVATHAITWLFAVTKLFVTVIDVPAAAIFTRPVGLLMVWLPVVPGVVIVEVSDSPPVSPSLIFSVRDVPSCVRNERYVPSVAGLFVRIESIAAFTVLVEELLLNAWCELTTEGYPEGAPSR
jgi:hypothetical protein